MGAHEARKSRPCLITEVTEKGNQKTVSVSPISNSPRLTKDSQTIMLAPHAVNAIGLDKGDKFLSVAETNKFAWPGCDLRINPKRRAEQTPEYGKAPADLVKQVTHQQKQLSEKGALKITHREGAESRTRDSQSREGQSRMRSLNDPFGRGIG